MDKLPDTIEECHQVIRLLLRAPDDLSKRVEALLPPSKSFKLFGVKNISARNLIIEMGLLQEVLLLS